MDTSSISFHEIEFELVRNSYSDITYIHLHGDEKTAKMLLSEHITQKSGRAFFIKSNAREVELGPTMVDPNRLFSRYGSMKALRKFKPNWKPEKLNQLLDELDRARKLFLVNIFPSKGGIIVALHNNFRGYNVHSELYKSQSNSIKKGQNPRDFIICTDAKDYQILKNGPYNVVLQNKIDKENDGSLSWAALINNVRYINIETRLGWLSKQRKMLNFVEQNLRK